MSVKMRVPGSMLGRTVIFSGGNNSVVPPTLLLDVPEQDVSTMLSLGLTFGASGIVPDNRRTTGVSGANGANAVQSANAFSGAKQIYLHFQDAAANDFNAVTAPAANMISVQGADLYDTWKIRVINQCGSNIALIGGNGATFIDSPVLGNGTFVDLYALMASASNIAIYTEGVGNAT
jgi:hypothetical protein